MSDKGLSRPEKFDSTIFGLDLVIDDERGLSSSTDKMICRALKLLIEEQRFKL